MITRGDLQQDEYHPYFNLYLDLISNQTSINKVLVDSINESITFINTIDQDFSHTYSPGKWTIGQVVLHMIDTERVFAYRALRFLRGDQTALAGFDQDAFINGYGDGALAKADLISSLQITRAATIEVFKGVNDEVLSRKGIASGSHMSARVVPFLIAGHNKHHENILRERYL